MLPQHSRCSTCQAVANRHGHAIANASALRHAARAEAGSPRAAASSAMRRLACQSSCCCTTSAPRRAARSEASGAAAGISASSASGSGSSAGGGALSMTSIASTRTSSSSPTWTSAKFISDNRHPRLPIDGDTARHGPSPSRPDVQLTVERPRLTLHILDDLHRLGRQLRQANIVRILRFQRPINGTTNRAGLLPMSGYHLRTLISDDSHRDSRCGWRRVNGGRALRRRRWPFRNFSRFAIAAFMRQSGTLLALPPALGFRPVAR